jgi:hypothetical protein
MLKENITGVIFIPGDKTAIERKRLASYLHPDLLFISGSHSDFYLLGEINTSLLDHCQQNRAQHFYKCPVHHLYSFYKLQDVYKFMKKSKELNTSKDVFISPNK